MPKDLIGLSVRAQPKASPSTEGLPSMTARRESVPCVYCQGPIQSASFAYSSGTKRLVSASCPTCGRGITAATATLRRWMDASIPERKIDLRT